MSIIDIRTHVGTQPTDDRAYTPVDLLATMDAAGIDQALCTHWGAIRYDTLKGNEEAAVICATTRRLWPVAVVNPAPYVELADTLEDAQFIDCVGFVLLPDVHGWSIAGIVAERAFQQLDEIGMPVIVEITTPNQPTPLARATEGMESPIVLAGVNYALLGEAIAVLERYDHLYLEASRLCTPGVVELLCRTVGASRLLFGGGTPEWHPRPTMAMIQKADISPVAIEAILGGNARRLYGLDDADDEEAAP